MLYKKFYSSLVLLIALNVIIKPLWIFAIDRQVQNTVGVEEYGIYFSLLNLSIVFGFLLDFGLTNFVNRELAAGKPGLQDQLGGLLLLKFIFFIIYAAFVILVAKISGVQRWDILFATIIIQFLTFLLLFFRNVITANQWFSTDAWLSVMDKALMICFCGLFIFSPLLFGPINIDIFLSAQIIATTLAVVIAIALLLRKKIVFKKPSLHFLNRSLFFSILPFAIAVFLMSLHVRFDGFLLERMHANGAREAGLYAAAYRLLDASNMICFLISSFFMPFVARQWSEQKKLDRLVLQTRHLQIMFAITIAALAIFLAPWLQKILYHRDDLYGAKILEWCIPAIIGYALVQVYGTIMSATGSIVVFCYFNFGAVLLNVVMNILLIPGYGAFGCCIAALCSQFLLGITTMVYVHRRLHISNGTRSLIMYLATCLLLCGVLYGLLELHSAHWVLLFAASGVSLIVMLASRMISLQSWLSMLKK